MKENVLCDIDLNLLKVCVKCLRNVTGNKRVKDKKSQFMYKYTLKLIFIEVPPFLFTVSKHVVISYANN